MPPKRPDAAGGEATRTGRAIRIDHFVLARLEQEGLAPSPEADRVTLIRRVTLDLTGLPPTPAEVDAFLADTSPDAYEKVVDRLLASPRYGERMAVALARRGPLRRHQRLPDRRRAASCGAGATGSSTPSTRNMPFDQFTIEQLAGDLLPNADARAADRHRLQPQPSRQRRGRHHPRGVRRRVRRRSRRHDRDRLARPDAAAAPAATTTSTTRSARRSSTSSSPTSTTCRSRAGRSSTATRRRTSRRRRASSKTQLAELEARAGTAPEADSPSCSPSSTRRRRSGSRRSRPRRSTGRVTRGLVGTLPARWHLRRAESRRRSEDGDAGVSPPGRIGQAADFDGKRFVDAGDVGELRLLRQVHAGGLGPARRRHGGTILSRMADADRGRRLQPRAWTGGKLQVNLVKRWLDDAMRVETEQPLAPDRWHHVAGHLRRLARWPRGVKVYVDGEPQKLQGLPRRAEPDRSRPRSRCASAPAAGRQAASTGCIDDVRVYDDVPAAEEAAHRRHAESIAAIVADPAEQAHAGARRTSCGPTSSSSTRPTRSAQARQRAASSCASSATQLDRELPDDDGDGGDADAARHASC